MRRGRIGDSRWWMSPSHQLSVLATAIFIMSRMVKPRISRANLAVTYRCNHRCKPCNIWKRHQDDSAGAEAELTAAEIRTILEKNGMIWVSLTGGEPFLRDDIADILHVCLDALKLTSVVTNGSRPAFTEHVLRTTLGMSRGILAVNVSLHGSPDIHDAFTGKPGSWDSAVETLKRLSPIRCKRLHLGIEHILSVHNDYGQAEYIEKLAESLRVSTTFVREQHSPYYDNMEQTIVRQGRLPQPPLSTDIIGLANRIFVSLERRGKARGCVAGEYSCFIDPYGVTYPCLFFTPTYPVKSLRLSGYEIGDLDCRQLVSRCDGCWTPCETYATMMFRPWRLLV